MFKVNGWGVKFDPNALDGAGEYVPAADKIGGGKTLEKAIENAFCCAGRYAEYVESVYTIEDVHGIHATLTARIENGRMIVELSTGTDALSVFYDWKDSAVMNLLRRQAERTADWKRREDAKRDASGVCFPANVDAE